MTHENTLPAEYFRFLYERACFPREGGHFTYVTVCEAMHALPFKVLVAHDENRAADGVEIRNEFLEKCDAEPLDYVDLAYFDTTVLEVLVALAKKAEYMIAIPQHEMFHQFIVNLGLEEYHDECGVRGMSFAINRILRRFNERRYNARGIGGIFPLHERGVIVDQRRVELWYQMGAYMTENSMY